MPAQTLETFQLSDLLDRIGASEYQLDLQALSQAEFPGTSWDFKDHVGRDLGGLVTSALTEGTLDQIELEMVLREGKPWGQNSKIHEQIYGERSVMFEVVLTGLTGYYDHIAQSHPTFAGRKAARSEKLGPYRTLPLTRFL